MNHWGQIERELPGMQALATAGMTDEVRVTRPPPGSAEPEHDEWGNIVEPEGPTVYTGPAKFQHSDPYPSGPDAAEARWIVAVRQVHFPFGTSAVRTGDVVECVASQNPRTVGLKVRVRIDGDKTWNTAVRFNVVEVVGRAG